MRRKRREPLAVAETLESLRNEVESFWDDLRISFDKIDHELDQTIHRYEHSELYNPNSASYLHKSEFEHSIIEESIPFSEVFTPNRKSRSKTNNITNNNRNGNGNDNNDDDRVQSGHSAGSSSTGSSSTADMNDIASEPTSPLINELAKPSLNLTDVSSGKPTQLDENHLPVYSTPIHTITPKHSMILDPFGATTTASIFTFEDNHETKPENTSPNMHRGLYPLDSQTAVDEYIDDNNTPYVMVHGERMVVDSYAEHSSNANMNHRGSEEVLFAKPSEQVLATSSDMQNHPLTPPTTTRKDDDEDEEYHAVDDYHDGGNGGSGDHDHDHDEYLFLFGEQEPSSSPPISEQTYEEMDAQTGQVQLKKRKSLTIPSGLNPLNMEEMVSKSLAHHHIAKQSSKPKWGNSRSAPVFLGDLDQDSPSLPDIGSETPPIVIPRYPLSSLPAIPQRSSITIPADDTKHKTQEKHVKNKSLTSLELQDLELDSRGFKHKLKGFNRGGWNPYTPNSSVINQPLTPLAQMSQSVDELFANISNEDTQFGFSSNSKNSSPMHKMMNSASSTNSFMSLNSYSLNNNTPVSPTDRVKTAHLNSKDSNKSAINSNYDTNMGIAQFGFTSTSSSLSNYQTQLGGNAAMNNFQISEGFECDDYDVLPNRASIDTFTRNLTPKYIGSEEYVNLFNDEQEINNVTDVNYKDYNKRRKSIPQARKSPAGSNRGTPGHTPTPMQEPKDQEQRRTDLIVRNYMESNPLLIPENKQSNFEIIHTPEANESTFDLMDATRMHKTPVIMSDEDDDSHVIDMDFLKIETSFLIVKRCDNNHLNDVCDVLSGDDEFYINSLKLIEYKEYYKPVSGYLKNGGDDGEDVEVIRRVFGEFLECANLYLVPVYRVNGLKFLWECVNHYQHLNTLNKARTSMNNMSSLSEWSNPHIKKPTDELRALDNFNFDDYDEFPSDDDVFTPVVGGGAVRSSFSKYFENKTLQTDRELMQKLKTLFHKKYVYCPKSAREVRVISSVLDIGGVLDKARNIQNWVSSIMIIKPRAVNKYSDLIRATLVGNGVRIKQIKALKYPRFKLENVELNEYYEMNGVYESVIEYISSSTMIVLLIECDGYHKLKQLIGHIDPEIERKNDENTLSIRGCYGDNLIHNVCDVTLNQQDFENNLKIFFE